jgi:probable rRNA maturation factor
LTVYYSFAKEVEKFEFSSRFKLLCKDIVLLEGKRLGEISYIFVGTEEILNINQNFLKHLYLTDVITFDRSGRNLIKGDIFICPEVVFTNAEQFRVSRLNELYRVMIHGLLHLLGYLDHTEDLRQGMRQKENLYLSLGLERNYL